MSMGGPQAHAKLLPWDWFWVARRDNRQGARKAHISGLADRGKVRFPIRTRIAALMLGSDRSRGYCLEMICVDFRAGANLDNGNPEMLLFSMTRFFKFLPEELRQTFLAHAIGEGGPKAWRLLPSDVPESVDMDDRLRLR
jgi:hypothetical protein